MTTLPVQAGQLRETAVSQHSMQCMEVWGGNTAVDNGVVMPGLDVWVFGRPYEDQSSGGDVHYLSSCASGRITRLLVADVSGHGVKVNDVAIKLRGLMRRFVNTLKQGKFVGTLNSEFASLADAGCFATAVVATVGDGHEFHSGREFAAWLGLTPRQSSSGGKNRLGGITKRGNEYLRRLFIHGARSVLRLTGFRTDRKSRWAEAVKGRRGENIAAIALAAKHARILWALLTRGEAYQVAA